MVYALCVLAGLAVGGAVGWFLATLRRNAAPAEAERQAGAAEGQVSILREQVEKAAADFEKLRAELGAEREARARAETECQGTLLRLDEEKKLLDDARAAFENTFKALSSEVLSASNRDFLQLARKSMDEILATAKGDLDKRQESISGLVKPLADSLKRYEDEVRALERHRQEAYSGLSEQVKLLTSGQDRLQKETGNLVTALRRPEVRGNWGEVTLRRVVELSGMSCHCDFTEQASTDTESGRIRPDMIIHLPGGRDIVVDAKAPLDAYLSAVSAQSEEDRSRHIARHASQLRDHMAALSRKSYWEQFPTAPQLVVLFIPGEAFFAAAAESDVMLIEDSFRSKVVLAAPTTLFSVLKAVEYGWHQEQIAENAQKISDLGKQLYDRMRKLVEHVAGVGKGLEAANDAYNHAVASLETRVLPAARRFKDLGAGTGDDIPAIEPIETQPRKLSAPEVTGEF